MKSLLQDRATFDSNRLFWAPCTRHTLPSHFARIVDEVDELGMTPLMWASMYCPDATVISSLIEHGANPKARTKHGVTALHWCAHYNKTGHAGQVAQALLAAGADPATLRAHRGARWAPPAPGFPSGGVVVLVAR